VQRSQGVSLKSRIELTLAMRQVIARHGPAQ
jgi:hypothetical protein